MLLTSELAAALRLSDWRFVGINFWLTNALSQRGQFDDRLDDDEAVQSRLCEISATSSLLRRPSS